MADTKEYRRLRPGSLQEEHDDDPEIQTRSHCVRSPDFPAYAIWILVVFAVVSAGFNLLFMFKGHPPVCKSSIAGLRRESPIQIYPTTEYVSDNLTETAELWEVLSGDPGVVALPQSFVAQNRLPHALRYPWDEDKGVYLLQGFHNLHCLRTLYRYIKNAHLGLHQPIAIIHIQHCLDQLRQDVLCNADDTPRYAGFQDPPGTGANQVRMCKDWRALEDWALERTACFKHEDEVPGKMIDRFRSCPDGSKPWLDNAGSVRFSGKETT